MGTNYYLINKKTNKRLHLGKSSLGWQFCFQTNDEYKPTMNDMFKYIEQNADNEIWCDYGKITPTKFKKVIKDHIFGYNFKTYHYHLNLELHNYKSDTDFISNDGSWWCKVNFN